MPIKISSQVYISTYRISNIYFTRSIATSKTSFSNMHKLYYFESLSCIVLSKMTKVKQTQRVWVEPLFQPERITYPFIHTYKHEYLVYAKFVRHFMRETKDSYFQLKKRRGRRLLCIKNHHLYYYSLHNEWALFPMQILLQNLSFATAESTPTYF